MFAPYRARLVEVDGKARWWTVRCEKLPRGTLGVCDYDTRTIIVHPQRDPLKTLSVLAHELFHVCYPDLVEEATLRYEHNWLAAFVPILGPLSDKM